MICEIYLWLGKVDGRCQVVGWMDVKEILRETVGC